MIHAANAEIGGTYFVKSISFDNPVLQHRLNALGLSVGSMLKVQRKSLFKGPCVFDIEGQYICIRNCDACKIMLEAAHD
ncbi:ferrous iron transport protein A [Macrococcus brunensis]|uniref:Ferrous iron transport protein A n=1 Tax=Macrococcus brunensis TaxID=198483 RepID=A0A4R6BES4_9STAP|nr:FeoA family protein [Macrococcus brunensis]TDL98317.1 ferrous iron transport protein A [Macrococcus brunensis]